MKPGKGWVTGEKTIKANDYSVMGHDEDATISRNLTQKKRDPEVGAGVEISFASFQFNKRYREEERET